MEYTYTFPDGHVEEVESPESKAAMCPFCEGGVTHEDECEHLVYSYADVFHYEDIRIPRGGPLADIEGIEDEIWFCEEIGEPTDFIREYLLDFARSCYPDDERYRRHVEGSEHVEGSVVPLKHIRLDRNARGYFVALDVDGRAVFARDKEQFVRSVRDLEAKK